MKQVLRALFAPGFFASDPVHAALVVGAVVALVTGAVGVFTVIRGQAFAGHALGEVGSAGGSAAFLGGANPLWGFMGIAIVAAGLIELLGLHRPRARDVATGLVLAVCYRMLLLSSLSSDLAAARGVPVRAIGIAYLVIMAVAVSLAAETIGAILATALLVGPPATALRLTKRPGGALVVAGLIGVAAVWLGIVLAYDSYYWPPAGHGWPVSFFVVALVFLFYLVAGAVAGIVQARRRRRWEAAPRLAASGCAEHPGDAA